MNDFIEINEQRAQFYWWMSSLFAKELTTEDLQHYFSDEVELYLTELSQTDALAKEVSAFREKLAEQKHRQEGQLELAADFCELFLTTDKTGALPYASVYLESTGLLNGKPAREMATWLEKYQMAQKQEINEPFDHLALLLDFLGNLIIMTNQQPSDEQQEAMMQEQLDFMQALLLSWIATFELTMQPKDHFGFYLAATKLLVKFLHLDQAFLAGE